ncbi:MAG: hypothetical protein MZU84_00070 [Sphingobacterium sp.]|nr:hypothetical protein [Sphingobacterium sp.]
MLLSAEQLLLLLLPPVCAQQLQQTDQSQSIRQQSPVNFTTGAVIVCQNAGDETYTATATNSVSIAYSVSPAGAGVINALTGSMNWDAAFFGTATITANATGLCTTTTADRTVTVNPSTGPVNFTLRCNNCLPGCY